MKKGRLNVLVVALAASAALAMSCCFGQPVVALTPPMGWNSWNHFAGHVTNAYIRAAADALVSTGMREAGYVCVNIDDTWQGERDAQGVLHPNERFPDMKALGGRSDARARSLADGHRKPRPVESAPSNSSISRMRTRAS